MSRLFSRNYVKLGRQGKTICITQVNRNKSTDVSDGLFTEEHKQLRDSLKKASKKIHYLLYH